MLNLNLKSHLNLNPQKVQVERDRLRGKNDDYFVELFLDSDSHKKIDIRTDIRFVLIEILQERSLVVWKNN